MLCLTSSFHHIFVPASNHYMLLTLFILSLAHCTINRKTLHERFTGYKKSTGLLLNVSLALIVLSIAFYISFMSESFDSEFYHQQNIRWNEEYKIIPGLANLEDRFGFNSAYLLISAIFSFRFLFGDAIYTMQGLLFTLMILSACAELYRSKGNIKYVLLVLFLLIILIWNHKNLDNTSTDIIPLLGCFYYISKTALDSHWINRQPLLACLLPVTLVTYKLFTVVFCLIVFYIVFYLIREKKYRNLNFIIVASVSVMLFWCIRNIIISGYLAYPFRFIDIFSFDWKVPLGVAMLQEAYIKDYAEYIFLWYFSRDVIIYDLNSAKLQVIYRILSSFIYLTVVLSPFILTFIRIKNRSIDKNTLAVYVVSLLSVITGLLFAPDLRFINGFLFGIALLMICMSIKLFKKEEILFRRTSNAMIIMFTLLFMIVSFKNKDRIIFNISKGRLTEMLYKPMPHPLSNHDKSEFDEYNLNGTVIYITRNGDDRTFEMLPATNPTGIPYSPFEGNKIQHIETVELRGSALSEGFRTKKEYIGSLNENAGIYKAEYKMLFYKKMYKDRKPFW